MNETFVENMLFRRVRSVYIRYTYTAALLIRADYKPIYFQNQHVNDYYLCRLKQYLFCTSCQHKRTFRVSVYAT